MRRPLRITTPPRRDIRAYFPGRRADRCDNFESTAIIMLCPAGLTAGRSTIAGVLCGIRELSQARHVSIQIATPTRFGSLAQQSIRSLADPAGDQGSAGARQGRAAGRHVPDAAGAAAWRHPGANGGSARIRLRRRKRLASRSRRFRMGDGRSSSCSCPARSAASKRFS